MNKLYNRYLKYNIGKISELRFYIQNETLHQQLSSS